MPFDRALRLASTLLASAAFIGLALGVSLPEWLTLLAGSALILRLLHIMGLPWLERLAAAVVLSPATWNIFLVLGFLGFWIDLLWISGELLPAGIHFLLILMVIKLFNLQSCRDHIHLYAISLMAMMASATLAAELWYVPIFMAYLVTGVWSLVLHQLVKESGESPSGSLVRSPQSGPRQEAGRITPQLFWTANGLALGALCFTVAIFFVIPRTSAGFFQKGPGASLRTAGFSETVDLGTIGPIKRDPSVVMRVELPDRPLHEHDRLYLRGVAYDWYDGKSWTNRLTSRRVLSEPTAGTFLLRSSQSRSLSQLGPVIRQNILLEALDTAVLFAVPFAESVSGPFLTIQSDSTGAIYLPFPSASRLEYSVLSRQNPVQAGTGRGHSATYSESFARHFLQVPPGSERVAAFAREIIQGQETAYERARAIEAHLSRHFRYSLDIAPSEHERPLEEFLFNRKTGYCEHYATAMVVMLRTVGIPARLVTGFLASEWNDYGGYYVVRQRDAHAWVEAHLPQSGWVTMDPTPEVNEEGADSGWSTLSRVMDSIRLKWNRVFVQYSAADQLAMMQGLKAGTAFAQNHAWDSLAAFLGPLAEVLRKAARYGFDGDLRIIGGLLGLALAGLGAIVWLTWKRLWSRIFRLQATSHKKGQLIAQLYQTMIRQCARQGIPKPATATPLEFLRVIQREWNIAGSDAVTVTNLYCRARFGNSPLTQDEMDCARQSLRQMMTLERRVH
jgi:hypothetical protein